MTYLSVSKQNKTAKQFKSLVSAMDQINDMDHMAPDRNYLADLFNVVQFLLEIGANSRTSTMDEDSDADEEFSTCDISGLKDMIVSVEIKGISYEIGQHARYLIQGLLNGAYSTDELIEHLHSDRAKLVAEQLIELI